MRADELPPALLRALRTGKASAGQVNLADALARAPGPRRRGVVVTPWRWRCHSCGATFRAWAPAERHADAERHGRMVCWNPHDAAHQAIASADAP